MAQAPPTGWIEDSNNPGWFRDPNGDPTNPASWFWHETPEGYVRDTNDPRWWYDPNKDAAFLDAWWHDPTVTEEPDEPTWYLPVLAFAQQLYGKTPYDFGGDRVGGAQLAPHPPHRGWDCIGFVMNILDAAVPPLGDFKSGIHQGYINAEKARQLCAVVPPGQVQPGDLIFFEKTYNTPGASHVGLVVDPVRHVMADDHDRGNGTGPGETDWSKGRWPQHFLAFGRVPR